MNQLELPYRFKEKDRELLYDYIRSTYNEDKPLIFWIDLFCGCGGVTEGYSRVENNYVVACVNHDEYAIKSHHKNHPKCIHYTEDIRDWNVIYKIKDLVGYLREKFPGVIIALHASLECTHHSKARGGGSRDADSRTLGNHLIKYLIIDPDYITIENVKEFLTWGPLYQVKEGGKWRYETKKNKKLFLDKPYYEIQDYLKKKGIKPFMKPIIERKCQFYNEWRDEFISEGYDYELVGGKTRALKFIGNAVPPKQAEANAKALTEGLSNLSIKKVV